MRWGVTDRPVKGNEVSQWFAFWPVTVKGETRWLEWVAVEYRVVVAVGVNGRPGQIQKHALWFVP